MAVGNDKGSYYVYWDERDKNGKKKRQKKYFGSGPVNEIRAQKFNERMGFGVQKRTAPQAVLFGQFIEAYFKHLSARTKNKKILENASWNFSAHIIPFWAGKDIYDIVHSDLDDYIIYRKDQRTTKGTPPKQVSINREIDDIQQYLGWCVKTHKILSNPLVGYARPKDDREIIEPPSIQEINLLIEKAAPHLQRFLLISFYTGVRPGPIELGSLKWENVSWDENKILIRSADKGGLNSRRIDIHEALLPLLKRWFLEDHNNKKVTIDNIIHWNNKPVNSIKTAFKRAKERAQITRRIRPYDVRHAHVTQQLDAGADLKAVSQNVGHKSPDTTIKVYQHISSKLQKEAIAKLPELKVSTKNKDSDISDIFDVRSRKRK